MKHFQQIALAIFKAINYQLFGEEDYTEAEQKFAVRYSKLVKRDDDKESGIRHLNFGMTKDNTPVLLWESAVGQTIACRIHKDNIMFVLASCYDLDRRSFTVTVQERFGVESEKTNIVFKEIESIKEMLKDAFPQAVCWQ